MTYGNEKFLANPKFTSRQGEDGLTLFTSPVRIGDKSRLVEPTTSQFNNKMIYMANLEVFKNDEALIDNIEQVIKNAYESDEVFFTDKDCNAVQIEKINTPKKENDDAMFAYSLSVTSKEEPEIIDINGKDLREQGITTVDGAIAIASLLFKPYHVHEQHGVSVKIHNLVILENDKNWGMGSNNKRTTAKEDFAYLFSGND